MHPLGGVFWCSKPEKCVRKGVGESLKKCRAKVTKHLQNGWGLSAHGTPFWHHFGTPELTFEVLIRFYSFLKSYVFVWFYNSDLMSVLPDSVQEGRNFNLLGHFFGCLSRVIRFHRFLKSYVSFGFTNRIWCWSSEIGAKQCWFFCFFPRSANAFPEGSVFIIF